MIVLGLTGGIGMGKSTTASLFAARGVPVWDADTCVHRLYEAGPAAEELGKAFPSAISGKGIDRNALKKIISECPSALKEIEQIVHPRVAADRKRFLTETRAEIVLLDIPLLFETGAAHDVDKIIVVSVPADVQKARVLARGTMSEDHLEMIVAKQMSDAEKRARADFVIETLTLESARHQVDAILEELGYERDRS